MCGSEMVTKYPTNGLESHWNLLEGWIRSGSSGKSSEGFEFRQAGWIYPPPCASGAGAIMRQQARADSSAFPRQDLQSLTFLYPHLWGGGDDDGVEVPQSSSVIHPRERGAAWHVALRCSADSQCRLAQRSLRPQKCSSAAALEQSGAPPCSSHCVAFLMFH